IRVAVELEAVERVVARVRALALRVLGERLQPLRVRVERVVLDGARPVVEVIDELRPGRECVDRQRSLAQGCRRRARRGAEREQGAGHEQPGDRAPGERSRDRHQRTSRRSRRSMLPGPGVAVTSPTTPRYLLVPPVTLNVNFVLLKTTGPDASTTP